MNTSERIWTGDRYITADALVKTIHGLTSTSATRTVGWYHYPECSEFNIASPEHPPMRPELPYRAMYPGFNMLHFYLYKSLHTIIMVVKGTSHLNEALDRAIEDDKSRYEYYWTDPEPRTRHQIEFSERMTQHSVDKIDSYHLVKDTINDVYVMNGPSGSRSFTICDTYYCTHCGTKDKRSSVHNLYRCPDCNEVSLPCGTLVIHDEDLLDDILTTIGGPECCTPLTLSQLGDLVLPMLSNED